MAIYKKQKALSEKDWSYNEKNYEIQQGIVTVRHKNGTYIDLPCTVENPVKLVINPVQMVTNTITRLRLNAGVAIGASNSITNTSAAEKHLTAKVTINDASTTLLLSKTARARRKGEIFVYGGKLYEFLRDLSVAATYGASQGGVTKGLSSTYNTIRELKEYGSSTAKNFLRVYNPYSTSAAATDSALQLHLAYEVVGFKP